MSTVGVVGGVASYVTVLSVLVEPKLPLPAASLAAAAPMEALMVPSAVAVTSTS